MQPGMQRRPMGFPLTMEQQSLSQRLLAQHELSTTLQEKYIAAKLLENYLAAETALRECRTTADDLLLLERIAPPANYRDDVALRAAACLQPALNRAFMQPNLFGAHSSSVMIPQGSAWNASRSAAAPAASYASLCLPTVARDGSHGSSAAKRTLLSGSGKPMLLELDILVSSSRGENQQARSLPDDSPSSAGAHHRDPLLQDDEDAAAAVVQRVPRPRLKSKTSSSSTWPIHASFPSKLFHLLERAEAEQFGDVISFLPDGKTFKIHQRDRFVQELLPKCFKTKRMASFQKQLNLYGFKRIRYGINAGGIYHEFFQRQDKRLVAKIQRSKLHTTTSNTTTSNNTDTDTDSDAVAPKQQPHTTDNTHRNAKKAAAAEEEEEDSLS